MSDNGWVRWEPELGRLLEKEKVQGFGAGDGPTLVGLSGLGHGSILLFRVGCLHCEGETESG